MALEFRVFDSNLTNDDNKINDHMLAINVILCDGFNKVMVTPLWCFFAYLERILFLPSGSYWLSQVFEIEQEILSVDTLQITIFGSLRLTE